MQKSAFVFLLVLAQAAGFAMQRVRHYTLQSRLALRNTL